MTEEEYSRYTAAFNSCCAGDGTGFGAFFDKWYEPDASFEYVPAARKNSGRDVTVGFWQMVHGLMQEEIQPHTSFVVSGRQVAIQAPIDFRCKQDLEWVGEQHKAGTSFRLEMAAFYTLSAAGRFQTVRVYSIYHPDYQIT